MYIYIYIYIYNIYIYIYIYIYIRNKTFVTQRVIFRFESSKVWKKPKYNSLSSKCLIFDICILTLKIHVQSLYIYINI